MRLPHRAQPHARIRAEPLLREERAEVLVRHAQAVDREQPARAARDVLRARPPVVVALQHVHAVAGPQRQLVVARGHKRPTHGLDRAEVRGRRVRGAERLGRVPRVAVCGVRERVGVGVGVREGRRVRRRGRVVGRRGAVGRRRARAGRRLRVQRRGAARRHREGEALAWREGPHGERRDRRGRLAAVRWRVRDDQDGQRGAVDGRVEHAEAARGRVVAFPARLAPAAERRRRRRGGRCGRGGPGDHICVRSLHHLRRWVAQGPFRCGGHRQRRVHRERVGAMVKVRAKATPDGRWRVLAEVARAADGDCTVHSAGLIPPEPLIATCEPLCYCPAATTEEEKHKQEERGEHADDSDDGRREAMVGVCSVRPGMTI